MSLGKLLSTPFAYGFYLLFFSFFVLKKIIKTNSLENILFIASTGFFIAYIIQKSPLLEYHFLPGYILTIFTFFLLIKKVLSRSKKSGIVYAFAVCLAIYPSIKSSYENTKCCMQINHSIFWQTFVKKTDAILSNTDNKYVWQTIPAINPTKDFINILPAVTNAKKAVRFFSLNYVYAFYLSSKKIHTKKEYLSLLAKKEFFVTSILADLNKQKPTIIFSTKDSQKLLHYFDPRLDSILNDYKLYDRMGTLLIYVRKDSFVKQGKTHELESG